MMTDNHKSILLSVSILIAAIFISMGTTFYILYRINMEDEKIRLSVIAQSQARLLEAVANFDAQHSHAYPGGSSAATLSQFKAAHKAYKKFGKTGEFALGRRANGRLEFLWPAGTATRTCPTPFLSILRGRNRCKERWKAKMDAWWDWIIGASRSSRPMNPSWH